MPLATSLASVSCLLLEQVQRHRQLRKVAVDVAVLALVSGDCMHVPAPLVRSPPNPVLSSTSTSSCLPRVHTTSAAVPMPRCAIDHHALRPDGHEPVVAERVEEEARQLEHLGVLAHQRRRVGQARDLRVDRLAAAQPAAWRPAHVPPRQLPALGSVAAE